MQFAEDVDAKQADGAEPQVVVDTRADDDALVDRDDGTAPARDDDTASTDDDDTDVVLLDVGGHRFETSRAVLTKVDDSMLALMFGRCNAMLQPVDGRVSIFRDGEWFGLVLDFLEDLDGPQMQRKMLLLPGAAQEALLQELDYYGLVEAVFGPRPWVADALFRVGPEMTSEPRARREMISGAELGAGRSQCCAVFAGGSVVVVGGTANGFSPLKTTLLLDAESMTFTPGPLLFKERQGCCAVSLGDRVLVLGGYAGYAGDEWLDSTEMLSLSSGTVVQGPSLQTARYGGAAVLLEGNRVLVVGGEKSEKSTTEILCLNSMAFTRGPCMATPRRGCAAVALDDFRVLLAGGHSSVGYLNSTDILDVRTMTFTTGPQMASPRSSCAAVRIDAQHVLVLGGRASSSAILATTELLDLALMEFSPGPTMAVGRFACAASRIDSADGPRIVVVGGYNCGYLATTEVLAVDNSSTTA